MASADSPIPPFQGSFAGTPLPHLLLHLMHEGLTGTLELQGRRAPAGTILIVDGCPAKARTLEDHYLVPVLGQIGVMTQAQVERWLPELVAGEELHGRALVRKKVLTEDQVELGLHSQLARQLQEVVDLPNDTSYVFHEGVDALAGYGLDSPVRLDPLPFAWASLKKQPPWPAVNAALGRVTGGPIRAHAGAEPGRFGFSPPERAVVEMLRARPCRIDELMGGGGMSAREVDLLLYCLLIARQLEGPAPVNETPTAAAVRPAVDVGVRPGLAPLRSGRMGAVREEIVADKRGTGRRPFVDPRAEVDSVVPSPPSADSAPMSRVALTPPPPAAPAAAPFERPTLAPPAPPLEADEPDLDFPRKTPNELDDEVHTRPTVERMVAVSEEAIASYIARRDPAGSALVDGARQAKAIPGIPRSAHTPVPVEIVPSRETPPRRPASDRPIAPALPAASPASLAPETPRVDVEPQPSTKRVNDATAPDEPLAPSAVANEFETGWDDV